MKRRSVAVLGAGIMGCATALLLARRGYRVVMFDAADAPFSGASRWNEGKIHLGYLYSADPTLETAQKVIPGGLVFRPLVEQLLGCSIAPGITHGNDLFLCHRDSVVSADAVDAYLHQVAQRVLQHPDVGSYLEDIVGQPVERLSGRQLGEVSGSPDIVAGFLVPERSVSTNWIADRFVTATANEPRIEMRMQTVVTALKSAFGTDRDGPWQVVSPSGEDGPFDWVVNALWHGRIAVDLSVGIQPAHDWSNRFRLAAFIRTTRPVQVPCTVIATGPFGDVKNYDGRNFYVSWYPLGLMIDSPAVSPPEPPRLDQAAAEIRAYGMLDRLGSYLPALHQVALNVESVHLEGGWVHAAGKGDLSDPASALHRRDRFGIIHSGTYLSVDTGKYSTAPWLAHQVAAMIS